MIAAKAVKTDTTAVPVSLNKTACFFTKPPDTFTYKKRNMHNIPPNNITADKLKAKESLDATFWLSFPFFI